MIEHILLADSGTGQSEQMLNALMDLPAIQRAIVTVLHVVPPQVTSDEMQAKREEGAKTLAKAVESLHLDPNLVAVNTLLREGDPKDEVCRVAEDINADLIIMGSRGLKRLESILENSVSQYVFQLSRRPMLLVKDDIYVKKINRIMVAMNSSSEAQECLKTALQLLRDIKGGKLILAHINREFSGHRDLTPAEAEKDPVLAPALAEAKRYGVTCQCSVSDGNPGEEICRIANRANADLLLLGSPDRRPSVAKSLPDLDRLLGTSLSDYVRVYAPCPVLFTRKAG
ncbi:universal stress protein [Synechococcales cyanobacterium C]|uniref:Universal stress protein n=1 Tax=Petrachloros mirabilis ULC683 TaxID=2781853 RepID=A0A8K2A0E6_9CYAN|nr:universal stress protein [Petrachloros mirabilis]NCJ07298.1 universal stress protein [Petrachloros mirabilis ULC683]